MSTNTLTLLFGSQTRVNLLTLLLMHPGESFYIRQLSKLLNQVPTPIIRELTKLEKMGLVTSEYKANAKYYSMNTHASLFSDLQNIIIKTSGLGETMRQALISFPPIEFAFIYGSYATKEATTSSDLDLFIIGEIEYSQLMHIIKTLELKFKKEVQVSIFSESEFFAKKTAKNRFILQVVKSPKIMLIGTEHEFKRFAKQRTYKTD